MEKQRKEINWGAIKRVVYDVHQKVHQTVDRVKLSIRSVKKEVCIRLREMEPGKKFSSLRISSLRDAIKRVVYDVHQKVQQAVKQVHIRVCSAYTRLRGMSLGKKFSSRRISKIMAEMGVPSKLSGYKYLKDAISLVYKEPKYEVLINSVYLKIARKHGSTEKRVSESIAYAIEEAWRNGKKEVLEKYFSTKPGCAQFIFGVTVCLREEDVQVER